MNSCQWFYTIPLIDRSQYWDKKCSTTPIKAGEMRRPHGCKQCRLCKCFMRKKIHISRTYAVCFWWVTRKINRNFVYKKTLRFSCRGDSLSAAWQLDPILNNEVKIKLLVLEHHTVISELVKIKCSQVLFGFATSWLRGRNAACFLQHLILKVASLLAVVVSENDLMSSDFMVAQDSSGDVTLLFIIIRYITFIIY